MYISFHFKKLSNIFECLNHFQKLDEINGENKKIVQLIFGYFLNSQFGIPEILVNLHLVVPNFELHLFKLLILTCCFWRIFLII